MAWTAPRTWVVGEVLTAALLNTHVRDNFLETMTAKVTTAGDVAYATAANALARLGATAGNMLGWNAGGTALAALGKAGLVLVTSASSEQTTTSGSAVDLVSIGSLSIAATTPVLIAGNYRKSAGDAVQASIGLKVNATVVTEAVSGGGIGRTGGSNAAESGGFMVFLPPRRASYGGGAAMASTGGQAHSGMIGNTNAVPNATITDIVIRGISGAVTVTLGVQDVAVYTLGV